MNAVTARVIGQHGNLYYALKIWFGDRWFAIAIEIGPPTWWAPRVKWISANDGWGIKIGWLRLALNIHKGRDDG